MKINLIILMTILALTALWTAWSNTHKPNLPATPLEKIANFSYMDWVGNEGRLHDHEGRVVFLHFWATWCAPCIVELPELVKLTSRNQDKLIVLAISKDKTSAEMKRFINKLDMPIPPNMKFIFDKDKAISEDIFNIIKLPETIIIRPDLTTQQKIIGAEDNWNSKKWMNHIEHLSQ